MHTMGPDAQNLLELVRGYLAAQAVGSSPSPACPLTTLGLEDVLTAENSDVQPVTLRNLVVVLDDIGRSSPGIAELFAGHYSIALALLQSDHALGQHAATFSLNGSHPGATHSVTVNFASASATIVSQNSPTEPVSLGVPFSWLTNCVWLCHSAALLGTLTRIREAISQPLNPDVLLIADESARSLVQAVADRHDHALGRGPYHDTAGFGGRYDNTAFTTVMRRAVLQYLDLLIEHSGPPLTDSLTVVYSRAVNGFGEPTGPAPVGAAPVSPDEA